MDKLIGLLQQRRFWVALIPGAVMAANAAGIPLTDGMLQDTGDKLMTGVMSVLALWSLFRPKA